MENSRLEEKNIIEDVKNLFRLEKLKIETINITIQNIRNLFRLEKENKAIKDRIITDVRNLFEHGDIRNIFRSKSKIIK